MSFISSLFPTNKSDPKKTGRLTDISSNPKNGHNIQRVASSSSNLVNKVNSSNVTLFLEPETILQRPQCVYLVGQIKEIAGLSDDKFDLYYRPAILSFTRLCQSVGASQRNHHSEPYGLIEHSLEVAMYAMRKSQGSVYFPDREVETIQWLERVFMYSCFIGGLLHDGGKIFTNFCWYTRNNKGKWSLFNHMIHKIPKESENVEYCIKPYQNKKGVNVSHQSSHELFASNLFQDVVPQAGLEWIISYSEQHCAELFIDLVHTVASDFSLGHELGECVKHADQVSTDDGVKRYHENNHSRDFVDLSDPNLPIFESFKSILKDLIASPGTFNLVTNKVAMGKYSQMERYGNLIFMSAKSVLPIAKKRLSDKGISLPNDQAIFTLLVDNKVTLPAPSGDTFWWVEFYSDNNANKSKEISYFVIDATKLESVGVEDLRCFDVKYNIADKSLCRNADDDVMPFNQENYPDMYSLLHDSSFETFNKKEALTHGNDSVIDTTSAPNHIEELSNSDSSLSEVIVGVANEDQAPPGSESESHVHDEPIMSFGQKAEIASDKKAYGLELTQSEAVVPKTTPVTPPSESPIAEAPSAITKPSESKSSRKNRSRGGNKKQARTKKGPDSGKTKSTSEGGMIEKMMTVGFGVNRSTINTDPKAKVVPLSVESKSEHISHLNTADEVQCEQVAESAPPPADSYPPLEAYDNMTFDAEESQIEALVPSVAQIVDNESDIDENERPFSLDTRIVQAPHEVPLSDRMEKLLARNHSLGCESDTTIFDTDKGQETLILLLKTWIPYIERGIENETIRVNEENAHISHIRQGVFFDESSFRQTFADDLVDELFEALSCSAATLLHNSKPEFKIKHESGGIQKGIVLTVRAFKPNGVNLPLYRLATLIKG